MRDHFSVNASAAEWETIVATRADGAPVGVELPAGGDRRPGAASHPSRTATAMLCSAAQWHSRGFTAPRQLTGSVTPTPRWPSTPASHGWSMRAFQAIAPRVSSRRYTHQLEQEARAGVDRLHDFLRGQQSAGAVSATGQSDSPCRASRSLKHLPCDHAAGPNPPLRRVAVEVKSVTHRYTHTHGVL